MDLGPLYLLTPTTPVKERVLCRLSLAPTLVALKSEGQSKMLSCRFNTGATLPLVAEPIPAIARGRG